MGKPPNHLAYVDYLRGTAVLMVILVHTAQKVPNLSAITRTFCEYGQLGVQLFFIASAYTLCLSFERRRTEAANVISFYIRRIFRIAPLYYVGILVYACLYLFQCHGDTNISGAASPYVLTNIAANITFTHGLVPLAGNSLVPGGWSIGTEMLFYAIFPPLFLLSNRLADAFGAKGMLLLFCLSFALNASVQILLRHTWLVMENNGFMYFSILNQLPVFVTGIAAFMFYERGMLPKWLQSPASSLTGFLGFTLITLAFWKTGKSLAFAAIPTTAGISFAFLLGFLRTKSYEVESLRYLGKISYSMYIFHFLFALYLMPSTLRILFNNGGGELVLLFSFLFVVLFTVLIAGISEKTIETRGIAAGAKFVAFVQRKQGHLGDRR